MYNSEATIEIWKGNGMVRLDTRNVLKRTIRMTKISYSKEMLYREYLKIFFIS